MIELQKYLLILLSVAFMMNLAAADSNNTEYSVTDSLAIAEITLEKMQLYQTEYLPLSLAEIGRQSITAWRGMSVGFLDYEFDRIALNMPLWGYWDNQLVPIEFIRNRYHQGNLLNYYLLPVRINPNVRPLTRIAYSQDVQFELSYLDVDFRSYYRPKSFFHLSGNNLLRSGSAPGFTDIQINTYRGQFHHHFSDKWNIDLWYWQVRHKFNLSPFPLVEEVENVHRIGQIFWINVNFLPDSTRQFVFTPYLYKWGDRYNTQNFSIQRKTEMYSLGMRFLYQKIWASGKIGFFSDVIRHEISEAFAYELTDQWDGRLLMKVDFNWHPIKFRMDAGYRFIQANGSAPEINLSFDWKIFYGISSIITATSSPKSLPMSLLYWKSDTISALEDPHLPLRQGVEWRLRFDQWQNLKLLIVPYYNRFINSWGYDPANEKFVQMDYDNSGIMGEIQTHLLFLRLEDQIAYNFNYQKSFTPQIRNVLKILLPLSLFNKALNLDSYLIYHYFGNWRQLDYNAYVNQYFRTEHKAGNFHVLDAKILAHIKTATLFVVWNNLLSQDYAIVNGYMEIYRQFRFGIYWTLFD
jgi:hypothetical protein